MLALLEAAPQLKIPMRAMLRLFVKKLPEPLALPPRPKRPYRKRPKPRLQLHLEYMPKPRKTPRRLRPKRRLAWSLP